ncbi:lipocalin family protein [Tenacibaculum larymnensis]|uniref:Lipocalin family protein n=1 Tax=Tenacibaculum larymnensis TaxID=2878201 RepID=A0A9X4EP77_9FLAO|nr:lipocalin family protein [Tenacibaculum larymnensis]MDE1207681.1 lipocalin family protein [Tenacibaculum larymnensis]
MKTYNSTFFIKHIKLLCGLFLVLTLANCSKDDDDPQPEPTTQELLMNGKWYWSTITDFNLTDCNKNSYFLFAKDELTKETFGENNNNKCVSMELSKSSYQLINEKTLVINDNGSSETFTIETISKSELILAQHMNGKSYYINCVKK